jgi:phosphoribosylformylglycinamidine synthase
MASRGDVGIALDLDRVPLREANLSAYEILLSESQERMLIVARVGAERKVEEVFAKWDLDAVVVGRVTDDGMLRCRFGGEEVVCLPVRALTEEAPCYERPYAPPPDLDELQRLDLAQIPPPGDYGETLLRLLASPNVACKSWIFRQYDQWVGGNTLVVPGSDAAVLRIKGTAKALALSVDCNSRYCLLDPYVGAMIAVVEAARNVTCAGARPLGLTDCLNFGNPEKPEVMWQFRQAVAGIRDACKVLGIPVVSGNVSFYNETDGRSIPPTPAIALVGLLDDVNHHTTQWFKGEGDVIVLLGRTREELGGSEYLATVHGTLRGTPPWIDLSVEKQAQEVCRRAAREGLLRSAHDLSEGGLAVALAESCVSNPDGGGFGVEVEMEGAIRPDAWLFGESQSRILLSLRRKNLNRLRDLAAAAEVPCAVLGEVRGQRLRIGTLVDLSLADLRRVWGESLAARMRDESP